MNPNITIASLLSLLGLSVLLFWLWRQYRIDAHRQRLFEIRDDLFDLALDGEGLSFSHPAYRQLRTTLNGGIRFAGDSDLFSLLMLAWFTRDVGLQQGLEFERQWLTSVERLPPGTKKRVIEIRSQMHTAMVQQIFLGSPVLSPIVLVLLFLVGVGIAINALVRRAGASTPISLARLYATTQSKLDATAFEEGCLA